MLRPVPVEERFVSFRAALRDELDPVDALDVDEELDGLEVFGVSLASWLVVDPLIVSSPVSPAFSSNSSLTAHPLEFSLANWTHFPGAWARSAAL
jgi:hypothetical protein